MEKIGAKETKWLFVLLIMSGVTLGDIAVFVSNSGTAAFINCLCGLAITLLSTAVSNTMLKHGNLTEVFKSVYGKAVTFVFCAILLVVTVLNAANRMNMFARAIGEFVLTDTPRVFILMLFALPVLSAVLFNLEALSRYALAAGIVFLFFVAIIIFTALGEADYINICPVLGKGKVINVLNMLYVFSDIVYFYIISGHIKDVGTPTKAVIFGGFITTILTLFYTLCVPYPVSEKYVYPLYRLASLANSSVVLQRLDGLVFLMWMFLGFISAGALTLFAVIIFSEMFKLKDRRAVSSAFVFLVFIIALFGVTAGRGINIILPAIAFGVLPLTALLYKIKKNWRRKECLRNV